MEGENGLPWFPQKPERIIELDWETPEERGIVPAEHLVYLEFFPILRQYCDVALDAEAIERHESPKDYGVVIETRCSVLSKDSKRHKPVELHCRLSLELTEDEQNSLPLKVSPTISATWPSSELTAPVDVVRARTNGGKIGLWAGNAVAGLSGSLLDSRRWEEKFKRFDPRLIKIPGAPLSPRQFVWGVRAGDSYPTIEGKHYCGLWITHDTACFLQLRAHLDIWVDVKCMGVWRRLKTKQVVLPQHSWSFPLLPRTERVAHG